MDMVIGTVTITKIMTDDDVVIAAYSETPDGGQLHLIDALGMIELGKDTLIREAMGDDEAGEEPDE